MSKKITLAIEIPAQGPLIFADAAQIHQVLFNLVINAAEAAGDGPGHVRVALDLAAAADVQARWVFPDGWQPSSPTYACLLVSDTNGGMAPEIVDQVFDPFFSTKFTGRGLGLPVTLGVVKAHEGGITVESQLGRGTRFRVFLPVVGPEPQQIEETGRTQPQAGP